MTLVALALLIVLVGAYLADRTGAQSGGIGTPLLATPLISKLNQQATAISRARTVRCLSPARFRWHPGHLVPRHVRRYVIEQRRARLERDRDRPSMCGPEAAILRVFGSYGSQALSVAWCESRHNIYARNGQYLGLFQMGEYARSRYGHSWTALGQSRSAYRYFVEAGADWSPWACKP